MLPVENARKPTVALGHRTTRTWTQLTGAHTSYPLAYPQAFAKTAGQLPAQCSKRRIGVDTRSSGLRPSEWPEDEDQLRQQQQRPRDGGNHRHHGEDTEIEKRREVR